MSSFSNKLKQIRIEKGLTQKELAKLLNVSPAAYSLWEKGEREPRFEILRKLCNIFNVDISYLMNWDTFEKAAYKGATSEPQKISSKGQDLSSIIDVIQSLGFHYIDILENDKLIIALDKGQGLYQFFVPLDEINDIIADCESTLRDKIELLLIKKETAHNKNTINEKADIN